MVRGSGRSHGPQRLRRIRRANVCAAVLLVAGLGLETARGDVPPVPPQLPSLVITEMMYNPPPELAFPLGQWFEVYNASDAPAPLTGLLVLVAGDGNDPTATAHTISGADAPVVEPHGYVVLGASKAQAVNGGMPVAYSYGQDLVLPLQGGVLGLYVDGVAVDEVKFGPAWGEAVPPGKSWSLEAEGLSAAQNDDPAFWCESVVLIAGASVQAMGTPGTEGPACDSDGDGLDQLNGDCNDLDANVLPGMTEKCNNVDDDCDGQLDEPPLADTPSWPETGVCALAAPWCEAGGYWTMVPPEDFEESELTCDFKDNDCDGVTDEELRNGCDTCGLLQDICDGLDNDCDGQTDEDAAVEPPEPLDCGFGTQGLCASLAPVCAGSGGWTCPQAPVGWQQEETTCDGWDNDCDGTTDEEFPIGAACKAGQGGCRSDGLLVCAPDGQGVVCDTPGDPGGVEMCGDNVDNDCDGETDEGFQVGAPCTAGVGACEVTGKYFCSPDDPLNVICSVQPLDGTEELCATGEDEDCDGETDELPCTEAEASPQPGCQSGTPPVSCTMLVALMVILALAFQGPLRRLSRLHATRPASAIRGPTADGNRAGLRRGRR